MSGSIEIALAGDRVSDADTKIFRQRWPSRLVATAAADCLSTTKLKTAVSSS
jgi:hypothetical protein